MNLKDPQLPGAEDLSFQEPSKDAGTQSNPASIPASQEQSGEEEVEETSLMEPEGGFRKP